MKLKQIPDDLFELEKNARYRNRMAKNMDPDGLDDDFASNAPPHGLR